MVPISTLSPVATYFLELKYTKILTIQKTAIIPQTTIQVMYIKKSWHSYQLWIILLNIGRNEFKWIFFASIDDDSDGDDTENEQDNTNDNINESNDDSLNCEKTTELDIKSKNDATENGDKIQTSKLINNLSPDTKPQNGDISTTSNGVDSLSPNASHQD